MLWTIEGAYLDAWSFAAPGDAAYRDFVDRWTEPAFAAYVDALAVAANATGPAGPDLDDRFLQIIEAEIGFWDMAWEQHRHTPRHRPRPALRRTTLVVAEPDRDPVGTSTLHELIVSLRSCQPSICSG
jgi:hypothetical protein